MNTLTCPRCNQPIDNHAPALSIRIDPDTGAFIHLRCPTQDEQYEWNRRLHSEGLRVIRDTGKIAPVRRIRGRRFGGGLGSH